MSGLLSDHELWQRLAQLPSGRYGAMLELCSVSKMTGQKIRARKWGASEPVRERLSNGFRLLDEGRIVFKKMATRTRKKTVAIITEERRVEQTPALFYPLSLVRELKNVAPHLSLPPLLARIRHHGRG